MNEWGVSDEAAALHRDALVWDMLLPWMYGREDLKRGTLPRMTASGYDFVSLTLAVDWQFLPDTIQRIAKERRYFQANADKYVLVETAEDVIRAKREGKLAVSFHFQGTNPVNVDPNMVELYYKLGVRFMLMAYNQKNAVGDGCYEPKDEGLSQFGVKLVREMQRVGMMVDCSHTGYRTSMDVLEVADGPVIFSHSNPRALWDNARNIGDDQIEACARTGGMVGINGLGAFLGDNDISVGTMVRHIDYVANKIGVDKVGIGLDYVYDPEGLRDDFLDHAAWIPEDRHRSNYDWLDLKYAPPEQMPKLTEALLGHGYSEGEVRGILGENWLRLARQVWK